MCSNDCNTLQEEEFTKNLCHFANKLKDFNSEFAKELNILKKSSDELYSLSTRYNILTKNCPDQKLYPAHISEDVKSEMLLDVNQKSISIWDTILKIESSYESLKDIHKSLEKESLELDWTNKTSVLINGSPKQKPLNYYMESALDILYQFDIAVICIKRYYGAAELENPESYEHLKSSFNISLELADFVNDYIINCAYILKFCDKKVK